MATTDTNDAAKPVVFETDDQKADRRASGEVQRSGTPPRVGATERRLYPF